MTPTLLYESPRFLIVNKPCGMAAHAGPTTPEQETLEYWLKTNFPGRRNRAGTPQGPWLVHRLDRDTAGCLLAARRKSALTAAQKLFERRQVSKIYLALVDGWPAEANGEITLPLVKVSAGSDKKSWEMAAVNPQTKGAGKSRESATCYRTLWKTEEQGRKKALLELRLLSGRTHQARVHCAALGTPVIGDRLYNSHFRSGEKLGLLAQSLALDVLLASGEIEEITALAPLPPHFRKPAAG